MKLTNLLTGVGTLIIAPCLCMASADSVDPAHTLWYKQPAKHWMKEALPIGNGSFGAMIFGSAEREKIHLNVDSLWTGDSNNTGSYQSLGVAYITFENPGKASGYRRTLDLKSAVHRVEFKANGVVQKRESFASAPDKVIVVQIEGKKMSGRIKLEDDLGPNSRERNHDKKSRKESRVTAAGNSILMQGTLVNDLQYAARLKAACKGGSISVEGNELVFRNVDTLAVLIAGETDYAMDMDRNWRGENPVPVVKARLDAAAKKGVEALRRDHVKDYRSLYDRFALDVGTTAAERAQLPTDKRLQALKNDSKMGMDPDFNELLVNYARYLMISCSRPGSLPANLQGLWCENNSPPWRSDYHSNINVQMNYWFALPMNLADCHQSFCDYVMAIRDARLPRTTKEVRLHTGKFATRGWAIKTENNIYGGSGWKWNFPGAAWYAQHLYEQYAFTQDQAVLKSQAYVVLKEICEFWEERLKVREDGTLVEPN